MYQFGADPQGDLQQGIAYISSSLAQADQFYALASSDPAQIPMAIANYKNVGAGIASPVGQFRTAVLALGPGNAVVASLFAQVDALEPPLSTLQPNATATSTPSLDQATQARNIADQIYTLGVQAAQAVGVTMPPLGSPAPVVNAPTVVASSATPTAAPTTAVAVSPPTMVSASTPAGAPVDYSSYAQPQYYQQRGGGGGHRQQRPQRQAPLQHHHSGGGHGGGHGRAQQQQQPAAAPAAAPITAPVWAQIAKTPLAMGAGGATVGFLVAGPLGAAIGAVVGWLGHQYMSRHAAGG